MKYIVYRTTCLINNKIYVGVEQIIQLQQYKLILPTYLVIGKQQGAKTVKAVMLIPW